MIDDQPLANRSFYRLKQVDLDGKFTYSITVQIFNRTTELLIYNAQSVKDILTLRWKSQSASLRNLQIVDMSGKIVLRKQIALNAGQNIVTLPVGHLANGIYVLNLIQDNNAESDFFIKK